MGISSLQSVRNPKLSYSEMPAFAAGIADAEAEAAVEAAAESAAVPTGGFPIA